MMKRGNRIHLLCITDEKAMTIAMRVVCYEQGTGEKHA
jgi:hypothetical protein